MKYVALDIETGAATGAALEMEQDLIRPNANIKNEDKKRLNVEEKRLKAKDRAALLDSSPITCVGAKTETNIFSVTSFEFGYQEELAEIGILSHQESTEKDLLVSLAAFVDSAVTDENTVLVTFNGMGFDLPKLRLAYARHSLEIPDMFCPGWHHIDLMLRYCKYYTIKKDYMVCMSTVLKKLGIATGGKQISGKLFPEMVDEGKYLEAVLYNVIDCIMTEQIYFRIGK